MGGETMTTDRSSPPLLEWGVASLALPGETVSGDMHLVEPFEHGALVAAVDGLGHGEEAAAAAALAIATLRAHPEESILTLLQRCHKALRETPRGVALTLASFNASAGTITWLGVGNVEGALLHAGAKTGRDDLLLYRGVVGSHMPLLRASVVPVAAGDTLVLATDGIRGGFTERLVLEDSPQHIADGILARHATGKDDALVLVARYLGEAE
jgi:hypothetical protein